MARIALDTNVLVYSEGVERAPADVSKVSLSRALIRGLIGVGDRPLLAVQTLAELHRVLVRVARFTPMEAALRVRRIRSMGEVVAASEDEFEAALELASEHRLQIFDALILASAVRAGCDLLVSEDLQDGFAWRGLVVTNPFGPKPDQRLAPFLPSSA